MFIPVYEGQGGGTAPGLAANPIADVVHEKQVQLQRFVSLYTGARRL